MKKLITILTIIFLSGCVSPLGGKSQSSSNTKNLSSVTSETILLQTKNYTKLITLYKERLKAAENKATRIKLAETYLLMGDPESTLFYLSPLTAEVATSSESNDAVDIYYLQAKAQYDLDLVDDAITTADKLLTLAPKHAETLNLLGILYADKNDFVLARQYFNQARVNFYDDVKVKNNIAILDIIEKDYQSAVTSLYPLYLNGQTDEQVNATLLIALSKMGNYQYVKSMLSSKYKEDDIISLFKALKNLDNVAAIDELSSQQKIPSKEEL
jgi:tight adherence protein D